MSDFNDRESINSRDQVAHAYQPDIEAATRTHSRRTLSSAFSNHEDDERLKQMITNNNGVEKVVSRLQEKFGELGPLEEPIDLERTETHPDPDSTFHPEDEWQYAIDRETGLRLVEFVEDDTSDPRNKNDKVKWLYTYGLALTCFCVALGSAIVTGDMEGPQKTFGVSEEVVILTVTLFVMGFGIGPLAFAPLSEEFGRRPVYVITLAFAVVFIIPCAVAPNIGTLLVCRFIDGIAFSAPMTLIGGSLADIWRIEQRGKAMALFSAAPFCGPIIGPLIGGYIGDNVGWRWLYWVLLIFSGLVYCIMLLIPETHHATILKKRAKMLREKTGDDRYRSISELKVRSLSTIAKESFLRPFVLLSELIVFLITLYMSIVYGLLYMFFFAYPVVYMEGKGWSASKTGLMFIPIFAGVAIATAAAPFINNDYNKRAQLYRDRGELPPPELRLIPMMVSCWFVPVGLFAFAWSSYPRVSWAGPCFSGLACGFGFCTLYNPANNYIVDSYQHYAASALASKTSVRSFWGAVVPLFTIQMYHRLGYQWATSLMAFISLACCAIPYMFYYYGATIRKRSRYAYSPAGAKEPVDEESNSSKD